MVNMAQALQQKLAELMQAQQVGNAQGALDRPLVMPPPKPAPGLVMPPGTEQNMVSKEINRKGITWDDVEYGPTQSDVDRLKANPSIPMVRSFNQKFGDGSATAILDPDDMMPEFDAELGRTRRGEPSAQDIARMQETPTDSSYYNFQQKYGPGSLQRYGEAPPYLSYEDSGKGIAPWRERVPGDDRGLMEERIEADEDGNDYD